jgi:hypothetical protein
VAVRQAEIDFDDPKLPDRELDAIDIGRILDASARIDLWIKQVRAKAIEVLKSGQEVPGWKLVKSRSRRVWADQKKTKAAAKRKYGEKAFTTKLLSPAQMEKLAGKEWVARYCSTIAGEGHSLAPESDYRDAQDQIALDFKDDN